MQLTISMLVSNRIGTIRKCMESLKPLLDQLDAELIAVDTVGPENSDGSLDVVKEYTDKIVRYVWNNDFSAARNAGLDLAKGEWFMFIDDDEWFDNVDEILRFFTTDEHNRYKCCTVRMRNYTDLEYNYVLGEVFRFFKMSPGMRFSGAVHEALPIQNSGIKTFNEAFLHHVGYLYTSFEDRIKKASRNRGIILSEIEKNPGDVRLIAQYVQEMLASGIENDAAIKYAEDFLEKRKSLGTKNQDVCTQMILTLLFQGYEANDTSSDYMEEKLEEYYSHKMFNKEGACAAFYIVGKCKLIEEKYEDSKRFYLRYLALADDLKKRLVKSEVSAIGDTVKYTTKQFYNRAIFQVGYCMYATGERKAGFEKMLMSEPGDNSVENKDLINWVCIAGKDLDELTKVEKYLLNLSHRAELRPIILAMTLKNDIEPYDWMYEMSTSEIKEAMNRYPQYAEKFQAFVSELGYRKQMKNVPAKLTPEMEALKRELIGNVRELLGAGRETEAFAILKEAASLGIIITEAEL